MIKFYTFLLSCFIWGSATVSANDSEALANYSALKKVNKLNLDEDLKDQLAELCYWPIEDLEYWQVPDILNEQQIRCSRCCGLLVPVGNDSMRSLLKNGDSLLEKFYSKDQKKLEDAKIRWYWQRRNKGIGLPPQCPVPIKIVLCASHDCFILAAFCYGMAKEVDDEVLDDLLDSLQLLEEF